MEQIPLTARADGARNIRHRSVGEGAKHLCRHGLVAARSMPLRTVSIFHGRMRPRNECPMAQLECTTMQMRHTCYVQAGIVLGQRLEERVGRAKDQLSLDIEPPREDFAVGGQAYVVGFAAAHLLHLRTRARALR